MLFGILDLLNKNRNRAVAISVIGSGGKTTLLRTLAKQAKENKIKTILTTTTHMKYPFEPFINIDGCLDKESAKSLMRSVLDEHSTVVSANDKGILESNKLHPCSCSKLDSVSNRAVEVFLETADLVISEADGSKRLPMKAPNYNEPVLLPDSDLVILVFGLSALGEPLNKVCHRFEIAKELLIVNDDSIVTEEMAAELLSKSYLEKLKNKSVAVLLNQADTKELRLSAKKMIDLLDIEKYEIIGNNPLRVEI